jgi:hypothetical protein
MVPSDDVAEMRRSVKLQMNRVNTWTFVQVRALLDLAAGDSTDWTKVWMAATTNPSC